jgi:hypothetical protein
MALGVQVHAGMSNLGRVAMGCLVLVTTSSVAAANPLPEYVGVGTTVKGDGGNPLDGDGPLVYVPLDLEMGWRIVPDVELHLGAAYGKTISIDEGSGAFGELTGGARWSFFRREHLRLALDLTMGWSRGAFENKQTVATTDGLVAEPAVQLELDLTSSLSLALSLLARGELLVGDVRFHEDFFGGHDYSTPAMESDHRLQWGGGAGAMLRYRF